MRLSADSGWMTGKPEVICEGVQAALSGSMREILDALGVDPIDGFIEAGRRKLAELLPIC
jgi:hypothetical protein